MQPVVSSLDGKVATLGVPAAGYILRFMRAGGIGRP
jgi:hypothetical protein